jgi:hypothetical protein
VNAFEWKAVAVFTLTLEATGCLKAAQAFDWACKTADRSGRCNIVMFVWSACLKSTRLMPALICFALACLACPANAQQTVEEFYRGKTINLYIGFAPGGSYDYYARLYARFMWRYIPGHPTIVPQAMLGAGSLQAANYLYAVAPKDGTALAVVTQTLMLEEAMRTPGVRYKATEFNGSAA